MTPFCNNSGFIKDKNSGQIQEMKEKARQKALAINEARQKERREKNGS